MFCQSKMVPGQSHDTMIIKLDNDDKANVKFKQYRNDETRLLKSTFRRCYFTCIIMAMLTIIIGLICFLIYNVIHLKYDTSVISENTRHSHNLPIENSPYNLDCGLDQASYRPFIAKGKPVSRSSWPYVAHLVGYHRRYTSNGRTLSGNVATEVYPVICGGTLINSQTILTAAHCLVETPESAYPTKFSPDYGDDTVDYMSIGLNQSESSLPWSIGTYHHDDDLSVTNNLTIFLGVTDLNDLNDMSHLPSHIIKRQVKRIKIHENYDSKSNLNDIALITFDEKIDMSKRPKGIRIACMPSSQSNDYPIAGTRAWSLGYGHENDDRIKHSRKLYYANTIIYNSTECVKANYLNDDRVDWNSQICAGNLKELHSACYGDSGSGLFTMEHMNGRWRKVVAGIVSMGYNCSGHVPTIFTRTSHYLNWINHHLDI